LIYRFIIAKSPVSEIVFILQHNTVNISKGTPGTDMGLTQFYRKFSSLLNGVSLISVPDVSFEIFRVLCCKMNTNSETGLFATINRYIIVVYHNVIKFGFYDEFYIRNA